MYDVLHFWFLTSTAQYQNSKSIFTSILLILFSLTAAINSKHSVREKSFPTIRYERWGPWFERFKHSHAKN